MFSNNYAKNKIKKIINEIYDLGYILDEAIINRITNSLYDVYYSL